MYEKADDILKEFEKPGKALRRPSRFSLCLKKSQFTIRLRIATKPSRPEPRSQAAAGSLVRRGIPHLSQGGTLFIPIFAPLIYLRLDDERCEGQEGRCVRQDRRWKTEDERNEGRSPSAWTIASLGRGTMGTTRGKREDRLRLGRGKMNGTRDDRLRLGRPLRWDEGRWERREERGKTEDGRRKPRDDGNHKREDAYDKIEDGRSSLRDLEEGR